MLMRIDITNKVSALLFQLLKKNFHNLLKFYNEKSCKFLQFTFACIYYLLPLLATANHGIFVCPFLNWTVQNFYKKIPLQTSSGDF